MKQWFRAIGALIFILLLTLMAAVLAAQTSAQTPPKEFLPKGGGDSTRQKMAGSGLGRNPFSLPDGIHLRSKSPAVPAALKAPETAPKGETKVLDVPPSPLPTPLKVRAILIGSQTRLALIDRHIVREGDSLEGEKILVIAKDYVVLGEGDKKRTLFLHQSPVHLTVEEK
jgi:hypothetical protein